MRVDTLYVLLGAGALALALAACDEQLTGCGVCAPGESCIEGACRPPCIIDADCDAGLICGASDHCVEGVRASAPVVSRVTANGTRDGEEGHAANHYDGEIVVEGSALHRAQVQLRLGVEKWTLEPCSASEQQLVLTLPGAVRPGPSYFLELSNAAGGCSVGLPLLRGPTGTPAMERCVGCITSEHMAAGAVDRRVLTAHAATAAKLSPALFAGDGADLPARSDHGHALATPEAPGVVGPADATKLAAYGAEGEIHCQEEFDLEERMTSVVSYWPGPAKRAELMEYGWLCWNRSDDMQQIHPLMPSVALAQSHEAWTNGEYKVCGRINWISGTADPNPSIMVMQERGYYYGLKRLDGVTNSVHGYWSVNFAVSSGNLGAGDRWTIWTCR